MIVTPGSPAALSDHRLTMSKYGCSLSPLDPSLLLPRTKAVFSGTLFPLETLSNRLDHISFFGSSLLREFDAWGFEMGTVDVRRVEDAMLRIV